MILTLPAAENVPSNLWAQLGSLWPLVAVALALLTAAVGAAGTFVGSAMESRREHRRWLRERRYEAYTRAFALIQGFSLNAHKVEKIAIRKAQARGRVMALRSRKRQSRDVQDDPKIRALDDYADRLYDSVADALAPIQLLGPVNVTKLALGMQKAYEAGDAEALGAAQWDFLEAAEKVLRIDGGRRQGSNSGRPDRGA
jgi:hypothetical protein